MLLEQVALSNSHWSVFNLQDLPGSEELTGTVLKYYLRIDRGSRRMFGCGCRYSIILMLVLLAYIHVI